MSNFIELSEHEILRILGHSSDGHLRAFQVHQNKDDDRKSWHLEDIAQQLASLPDGEHPRCLEFWKSSENLYIVIHARSSQVTRSLRNHYQAFNDNIKDIRVSYKFPPIKPGAQVRVARARPTRHPFHPIETRYGATGEEGRMSPIVDFLNNTPRMTPDSWLVIQVYWHEHRGFGKWQWNPLNNLTHPWYFGIDDWVLGHDENGVLEKKANHRTWYVDVRLVEIYNHASAKRVDAISHVRDAFKLWRREGNNGLKLDPLRGWSRKKRLRLLTAIASRRTGPAIRGYGRPYFSKDELAAIAHPPPSGAKVPYMIYQPIKSLTASNHQKAMAARHKQYLQELRNKKAPVLGGGRTRRISLNEAEAALEALDED